MNQKFTTKKADFTALFLIIGLTTVLPEIYKRFLQLSARLKWL